MACIPAESPYAKTIRDVLAWSKDEPDWKKAWQKLQEKWDRDDVCPDGVEQPFNIDAKLNGAYVAMGLLYGGRDWQTTMEVATRCGQDSDCNPASALGVLGAMLGYEKLREADKAAIARFADTKFRHTNYSFNDITKSSEARVLDVIEQVGGKVGDEEVVIPVQLAKAPPLELANFGVPVKVCRVDDAAWKWQGKWNAVGEHNQGKESEAAGSEATLKFDGTGIALCGNLTGHGGRADVYLDGKKIDLLADAYIVPSTSDVDLWRMHGLSPGEHTLRLVVRGDADPRSSGKKIMLTQAIVYRAE